MFNCRTVRLERSSFLYVRYTQTPDQQPECSVIARSREKRLPSSAMKGVATFTPSNGSRSTSAPVSTPGFPILTNSHTAERKDLYTPTVSAASGTELRDGTRNLFSPSTKLRPTITYHNGPSHCLTRNSTVRSRRLVECIKVLRFTRDFVH